MSRLFWNGFKLCKVHCALSIYNFHKEGFKVLICDTGINSTRMLLVFEYIEISGLHMIWQTKQHLIIHVISHMKKGQVKWNINLDFSSLSNPEQIINQTNSINVVPWSIPLLDCLTFYFHNILLDNHQNEYDKMIFSTTF